MAMLESPHRCFLAEVHEALLHKKSLRLMGLAVSCTSSDEKTASLTLDDGTALVAIRVPQFMIDACKASSEVSMLGKVLDCIVRVEASRDLVAHQNLLNRSNGHL